MRKRPAHLCSGCAGSADRPRACALRFAVSVLHQAQSGLRCERPMLLYVLCPCAGFHLNTWRVLMNINCIMPSQCARGLSVHVSTGLLFVLFNYLWLFFNWWFAFWVIFQQSYAWARYLIFFHKMYLHLRMERWLQNMYIVWDDHILNSLNCMTRYFTIFKFGGYKYHAFYYSINKNCFHFTRSLKIHRDSAQFLPKMCTHA